MFVWTSLLPCISTLVFISNSRLFKLSQWWPARPRCILFFCPSVLLGQPRAGISSPSPVLCIGAACPGGTGHFSCCFCRRRGDEDALPGKHPSRSHGQARTSLQENVIIGLVHFKLAVWEASNWQGNYGCLFLAGQVLFSLVGYPSALWWACLANTEVQQQDR